MGSNPAFPAATLFRLLSDGVNCPSAFTVVSPGSFRGSPTLNTPASTVIFRVGMAGAKQITPVKNIAGSCPTSPMQPGMRSHSLSAPHSAVDIEQILCTAPRSYRDCVAWLRRREWNDTEADFPREKCSDNCLHELFETQVERTPNAVALVYSKGAVSYRELDYQANRVAIHLRS